MPRKLPVVAAEVRSGDCNRCGSCCRGDPFNGEKGEGPVPGMCPFYAIDAAGVGGCSDRTEANPYYWNACRVWPAASHQIAAHADCSFRFE